MMAEAAPARDDNPALCCGVCLEAFDENECAPKFLHCYHSYCLRCITELSDGKGSLLCPTCRQETVLPPGGATELRYNFHIDDMKSIAIKSTRTNEQDLCADHKKVLEIWCKPCSVILCSKCLSAHKTHDWENIENLTEECDDVMAAKICQMDDNKKSLENLLKVLEQNKDELSLKQKEFDIILKKMNDIRDVIKEKVLSTEANIEETMISLAVLESLRALFQENTSSKHVVHKLQLAYNPEVLNKIEHTTIEPDCLAREQSSTAVLTHAFETLHVQCDQILVLNAKNSENDPDGCIANEEYNVTPDFEEHLDESDDDYATGEEDSIENFVEQLGPITDHPVMIFGSEGTKTGQFKRPGYITIDSRDHSVYVSDTQNNRVQIFNDKFAFVSCWNMQNCKPGCLAINEHNDVIVCALLQNITDKACLVTSPLINFKNTHMYIRERGNVTGIAINSCQQIVCSVNAKAESCIYVVNMKGQVLRRVEVKASWVRCKLGIITARDICIGANGNIIVLGYTLMFGQNFIIELNKYGVFLKHSELDNCQLANQICIDKDNRRIVSCSSEETGKTYLVVLTEANKCLTVIDSNKDLMELPWGLCTTCDGHVLVCDVGPISNRIFKFKYASFSKAVK